MTPAKQIISPIKASTQNFLEIGEIKEGMVILKDGSCILVISTTAINFGLLSEGEQDASIYSYAALLNSLTFPIQILIRSKRKDITSYLNLLTEQEKKITGKLLKEQMKKYKQFIEETVRINNVLEKKFFIVIPMSFLEIGIGITIGSRLKKQKGLPYPLEYILEKARTNLYPKRDHLFRLLNRLGLRSRQLSTQELVKLFFEIYNPETRGQILSTPEEYETPLVKPATDFLQTPPSSASSESPTDETNLEPPDQPLSLEPTSEPTLSPSPTMSKPLPAQQETDQDKQRQPLSQVSPKPVLTPEKKEKAVSQEMFKAKEVIKEADETTQDKIHELVKSTTAPIPSQSQPVINQDKVNVNPKSSQPIFDSQKLEN